MDTATHFLFGQSTDSLRSDATAESKCFSSAFDYALGCIAQKMRLGKLHWIYQDRQFNEACRFIDNYMAPIIAEAIQRRKTRGYHGHHTAIFSVAAATMTEKSSRPEQKVSLHNTEECDKRYVFLYELATQAGNEKELRDQIINTLVAGRDTTASLLSSTLFTLSRRRDVWDKLQAEVKSLGGVPPTFEQVKDLRYLKYLLNEVLRLFPVVPINAKFANKDTFLPRGGGPYGDDPIFVHKGQMVIWSVYSMHRREDLWGHDAADFKPERWEKLQPGFNFLPFNGGPRICPGELDLADSRHSLPLRLLSLVCQNDFG